MTKEGNKMNLITKAVAHILSKNSLFSQCESPEPKVLVKFFTPTGPFTWYVLGADERPSGDWHFFGVMAIDTAYLLGEFSLSEIKEFGDAYSSPFLLGLEREGGADSRTSPLEEGMLQTWLAHARHYERQAETKPMIPVMEGFMDELKRRRASGRGILTEMFGD